MIFISHTYKDKLIIEPIANTLAQVFGKDNVFYDSWSIQPGDGIIDKMNEGLEKCKYFIFFVSKNSLISNMVKLEWQNAIYKATNAQVKFIPVKLDDCMMPSILMQTLYIDVYGQGMENGIRQIIDVINGNNTFSGTTQTYENSRGYIKLDNKELVVEFRAETYLEPISNYLILIGNSQSEITHKCLSDPLHNYGFHEGLKLDNGLVTNAININTTRGTTPGFPVVVKVTSNSSDIKFNGLMKATSLKSARTIPTINI